MIFTNQSPCVRVPELITTSFRVSEGLCLHSHASKCALTWGILPRIVQRAEHVSGLLSRNELNLLLDEQMSEKEREELVECEAICRRFMEWDLEEFIGRREFGLVRGLLADIVEHSQGEGA
jgi:DNA mismatch repair protein MSH5